MKIYRKENSVKRTKIKGFRGLYRISVSLDEFNEEYLKYTVQVAESCTDRDLSAESMVIGTSAIIDTEIDGAVGMNSGIFNNPFIIGTGCLSKIY